jgi:methionyl-tRNA formyltransferase
MPAPRFVLVGEVRTAEAGLRGLLDAGHPPVAVLTTDVAAARAASGMSADYYGDLPACAAAAGIPVRVVADLEAEAGALRALDPDWVLVLGWPYLVRAAVLDVAPCIGMHPTRLPYRRGGAPLNWTILDGESSGAVTLLRLREGLDDGEILAQREFAIHPDDYVADVLARVLEITRALVAESVAALAAGSARWTPQRDELATYTRRRRPEDGRISWCDSAARIRNLVRAVSRPFPGAFTHADGRVLRVWRAELPRGYRAPLRAEPGTVLDGDERGILVSTRDNALLVTEAQPEGEAPLAGAALASRLAPLAGRLLA